MAARTDVAQPMLPSPLCVDGVISSMTAVLVAAAGDNPERLKSDAAPAAFSGAIPPLAPSGTRVRRHLNRGSDRAANNAPWTTARGRLPSDPGNLM